MNFPQSTFWLSIEQTFSSCSICILFAIEYAGVGLLFPWTFHFRPHSKSATHEEEGDARCYFTIQTFLNLQTVHRPTSMIQHERSEGEGITVETVETMTLLNGYS